MTYKAKADNSPTPKPQHKFKSKLDKVRILSYITAISCALTLGTIAYYTTTLANAQGNLSDIKAQSAPSVVALKDISPGSIIDAEALVVKDIPKTYVASDNFTSVEEVAGKVASHAISANTQLSASSVSATQHPTTLALALQQGRVAASVTVDSQSGMAGLLHQGDCVDILSEGSVICEKVRVLALDSSLSENTGEYSSVTVELSLNQAQSLQNAQENGEIRMVLHSEADKAEVK